MDRRGLLMHIDTEQGETVNAAVVLRNRWDQIAGANAEDGPGYFACFSKDSSLLLTNGQQRTLQLIETKTNKVRCQVDVHIDQAR
jgi:hypothetical protein